MKKTIIFILLIGFLLTFPSLLKSQYATFDMYTVFPTTNSDSSKYSLLNIGGNQDIYVKIYARDVTDLAGWQIDIAIDTNKIKRQSINNQGFIINNIITGEKNILQKNTSPSITEAYNTYNTTDKTFSCGALVIGGLTDAQAADGNGLMCILHFKTCSTFSINDTTTIQSTYVWFGNNKTQNYYPSIKYYGAINYINPLPVELISFRSFVFDKTVILSWSTVNEINNLGFYIERKNGNEEFKHIGFIQGRGSGTIEQQYNFKDETIHESGLYYYRLRQVDFDGKSTYSDIIKVTIEFPRSFNLYQNYPNPFNPETTIRYDVGEKDFITIKVYSIEGKEVEELVNEDKEPGSYEVRFNAGNYASGTYFYVLRGEHSKQVRKMMVIK